MFAFDLDALWAYTVTYTTCWIGTFRFNNFTFDMWKPNSIQIKKIIRKNVKVLYAKTKKLRNLSSNHEPNGCSLFSLKGTAVWPSIVPMILKMQIFFLRKPSMQFHKTSASWFAFLLSIFTSEFCNSKNILFLFSQNKCLTWLWKNPFKHFLS